MSKHSASVLSAIVVAVAGAACGSSSSSSSPSATPTSSTAAPAGASILTESADPNGQLKFTKSSLTAKAGKVTIEFTNSSQIQHNLVIAQGSKTLGTTPTFVGGTKSLAVTLQPGNYTFYCSVPGHKEAGMQGTLSVQ